MPKITRLSFNKTDWQRPTGDARKLEAPGTYNQLNGFGHEDWLFRSDWVIDGWRYAFIQGVNKSHAKLIRAGKPLDLVLYTIHPDRRRRYVATIQNVECLCDVQATDAVAAFKRRGWYAAMLREIKAVNGNVKALGAIEWAPEILNVRFRLAAVTMFPPDSFAAADDTVNRRKRYQLEDFSTPVEDGRGRLGSERLPVPTAYFRQATAAVECTPEHARMQAKLMLELRAEHPKARIVRERDFIDVSVRTGGELLLFEIKSALDAKTVLREALGQILEYAFHPLRTHGLPVKLVIVGRQPLGAAEQQYLSRLNDEFGLPLSYRVVAL